VFGRLLLLALLLPFAELVLLVWIASRTGALFTIALVVLPAALGLTLARYEGLRVWRQVQQRIQRGEALTDSLLDALMIWIAGVSLVIPGVLTDVIGVLLLIPPIRRLVRHSIQQQIRARLHVVSPHRQWPAEGQEEPDRDRIIDVRVIDVEPRQPGEE
jgi:UPF0716 protein FxsA